MMTIARSLARTAAFAALYLAATFAGRLTVMDETNLSMVWPAAGIAFVWFWAQRHAVTRWPDVIALATITMISNMATGATAVVALIFVVASLAQVGVVMQLIARWRPHLLGAGADTGLRGPRDLWGLLGAAFTATACGAAIGTTGLWLATGPFSWASTAVWLSRNLASMLLIGAVGLRIGYEINKECARHGSLAGWWRRAGARVADTPPWRVGEYLALTACSFLVYVVGFAYNDGLPLAFPLIVMTVWAALRLTTTFVVVHDLGVSVIAVLFTLHDVGPFADIPSHPARALVAQLYVILVAVVGLVLALGRDERDRLMGELAAEKERTSRRADLLSTIIDSMTDGLVVVESSGDVVLRNPAAVHLLGSRTRLDDLTGGLCHPDGTPVDGQDLPLARALAGEATKSMDLLVRNSGLPEQRIVTMTAAALPGEHGARSAVVLLHDVTAERRHRDELTSFAGVVAHDLLNPLTTVEGWTEATIETLDDGPHHPAVAEAKASLARVTRAATRMRVLINDLLAHTTARDATIASAPVALGELVDGIVAARVDAAIAAGAPVPRFTIEELHAVHADHVLVRQLLDNVIGNAIKYVAPGVTPELTIGSVRHDDTIEVTVADNGIGIPAGQHAAIFANFHRAHRAGSYSGTGLGLAICKRIVERHGGTIAATDNPGGGSRLTFTLPASHVDAAADRTTVFV